MKIINVLKEDTFDEILELFRKAPEGEVFLVLPKNGKLFRHDDHFAAFASEAAQGAKTVSVMTPNPDTAALAHKYGFTVVASKGNHKSAPKAKLASVPPPQDPDIRDEQDDAYSDASTSDATMGNISTDSEENDVDPLRAMHVLDEEGNPVDEDQDGKQDEPKEDELSIGDSDADFVAAPEAAAVATLAATRTSVKKAEPSSAVPVPSPAPIYEKRELDYIDAMWRDKMGGKRSTPAGAAPKGPSWFSRMFSRGASVAGGSAFSKKVAVGILVLAFVVLGSVVYSTTGSAHVALAPVGKPLDTQLTISTSDTYATVDDTFLKIPGQLLEVSKTATHTVNADGARDVASKARGTITVTNEFSSSPQTLITTTRFQSADGKVFRTLQNVTVPGSRVVSGKTVAGTVDVEVIADKPGKDYNVAAGKFTIMAFVEKGDTEKAKQFYGVSSAAMSGGASGPSTVVTQANYDEAQAEAQAKVKDEIKKALEAQGPSLMVIDGDNPVMEEPQSSARVDDAADAVTATATGTLKTVAFRSSDLQELIRDNILKKDRLVVLPEKLQLSYSDISYDADLGTLTFTVTIKGTGYAPLDLDAIKSEIGGKNAEQIREYFKNKEGVRSATVEMSPFWVRSVPEKAAKINIELVYDDSAQ